MARQFAPSADGRVLRRVGGPPPKPGKIRPAPPRKPPPRALQRPAAGLDEVHVRDMADDGDHGEGEPRTGTVGRSREIAYLVIPFSDPHDSDEEMEEIVIQPPVLSPAVIAQSMSRSVSAAGSRATDRTTQTNGLATDSGLGATRTDEESGFGMSTANEDTTDDEDAALPFDYGFDLDGGMTLEDDDGAPGPSTAVETREPTEARTEGGHLVITLGNEESVEAKKKRIAMENRK